jgi:hypothetical protein
VVDRSMTATENVKAVKPAKPVHEMPKKHMINGDGTLSKLSLVKLEKSLSTFAEAAREMEAQLLIATCNANIISPTMVQRLAVVKCEVEAEAAALQLFKENNLEEDTVNVVKAAMTKLNAARNQFKLIRKMIKVTEPNSIAAEHNVDPAPLDG